MSHSLRPAPDPMAAYRLRLEQALALLDVQVPSAGRSPLLAGRARRNRVQHAVDQARASLRRALDELRERGGV